MVCFVSVPGTFRTKNEIPSRFLESILFRGESDCFFSIDVVYSDGDIKGEIAMGYRGEKGVDCFDDFMKTSGFAMGMKHALQGAHNNIFGSSQNPLDLSLAKAYERGYQRGKSLVLAYANELN